MAPARFAWHGQPLTGATRHRVSLFGKLILQVEEQPRASPGVFKPTRWRDAVERDMTDLQSFGARDREGRA